MRSGGPPAEIREGRGEGPPAENRGDTGMVPMQDQ